jgi:hypothetical protein
LRRAVFLIVAVLALAVPGSASAACQPSAAHRYPVILVHGKLLNSAVTWNELRPLLQWVVEVLERPGPADPAFQPRC